MCVGVCGKLGKILKEFVFGGGKESISTRVLREARVESKYTT